MSVNLINEFGDMPELEGRMGVREVARRQISRVC